ncbi:retrovirus-related pol polyprotein from transposon TNT 1-94, partial [Tanacetum coccineum]
IVEIVLWYLDSGCSKHMTDNGTSSSTLFPFGQFCDSDLEVSFRKYTCFVLNLEGVDLLSGSRGKNLYTILLEDMMKSSPICLLSKASKTKPWLWHRRLSHLNFSTVNQLEKEGLVKETHKPKPETSINERLQMLHMDLCGPIRVESINGKRNILVIIDDYSRFTWVKNLKTKDETLDVIINFLKQAQVSLQATVRYLRTDNDTKFINQTLRSYTEDVGITHQTSVISSKLIPNQAASTSAKPPSKNDLDLLFQPMFDEYFKPSPSFVSPTISAATLSQDTVGETSSTTIDHDAPF